MLLLPVGLETCYLSFHSLACCHVAVKKSATPPPSSRRNQKTPAPAASTSPMPKGCDSDDSVTALPVNLPGKLSILGKEAVQQRDTAQKNALHALRCATATEALVRSLRYFYIQLRPFSVTFFFHRWVVLRWILCGM